MTILWALVTLTFLVLTLLGILAKITWYLAVDQYGYLAFAHDLMHGRIFHHWPPLDALAPQLPSRVDMLVQTYVYDAGKLYCRYAPGFPMVLAAWLTVFGDDGANYLNATIYMSLLVLLIAFQVRIFKSAWRALIGTALVVLFPTTLHLWALTLTRELATYLPAMVGLYLLLPLEKHPLTPRRVAAAGLALGFAGSVRPEALIYLLPAFLLAAIWLYRERTGIRPVATTLGVGALAVFIGLTPFLAYNWAATGSPFRPTQGMEIPIFTAPVTPPPPLPKPRIGFPPGAWRGSSTFSVQGGGLRLSHLPETLPGNVALIRAAYGDLMLVIAALGAVIALLRRRTLFAATVPYMILALLFYSCWSKPDARYLCGIFLMLPMLIVEGTLGTLDLAHRLAHKDALAGRSLALGLGALLFAGTWMFFPEGERGALSTITIMIMIAGVAGVSAIAAGAEPRRRLTTVVAPVLALGLVGVLAWRAPDAIERRASFQGPEMRRARETFNKAVRPGAVVITTEDVGRPAENIDYYSGVARAFYFTDLDRWRMSVGDAAALLAKAGMVPYLFVPTVNPARGRILEELSTRFTLELAADVPAARAMDYFVAAAFHRGVHMELYRLVPIAG